MNKVTNDRTRQYVDKAVQGALVRRVILQWVLFFGVAYMLCTAWHLLASGRPLDFSSSQLRHALGANFPVLASLVILLPVFVRDLIVLSNKFSGPMLRLRNELRELADGKQNEPLKFRDGDFWQEMAAEFNRVAERVRSQNKPASGGGRSQSSQSDGGKKDPAKHAATEKELVHSAE